MTDNVKLCSFCTVMECNLPSQNPITSYVYKRHYSRVWLKLFWISLPEAETQVIEVTLCHDIWLNFALVTVQSCAVYVEMYMQNCRQLPIASHCCLYKFSPKHSPIQTKPQPHWSKWWTIQIFWAFPNKLLSFWNLKIALVDLEILEKQYIILRPRNIKFC